MRRYANVIAIVLVLLLGLALVFPMLFKVRQPAARVQCMWNLGQIGMGLRDFHKENETFPFGTVQGTDLPPEKRLSLHVTLLPFVKQAGLYQKIDRKQAWDAEVNQEAVSQAVRTYICPGAFDQKLIPSVNVTHYVGMAGIGPDAATLPKGDPKAGCFGYDRRVSFPEVLDRDGVSQTMMAVETGADVGPWAAGGPPTVRGVDPSRQPYIGRGRPFGGIHLADPPGDPERPETVVMILFADGAVRPFLASMNPRIFEAFATYAGDDEVLDQP